MSNIRPRHIGLIVVCCALLVTAPRLAHAFIMGDGLTVNADWYYWTLTLTGVSSGVVLTLGNAYLTHVLASHFERRDPLSWLLAGAWVVYLLFAVALIAPALMVGLRSSPLADVLGPSLLQWAWAILAALSVEVLTAGSMAAYAIASRAEARAIPASLAVAAPLPVAPPLPPSEPAPVLPSLGTTPSETKVIEVTPVSLACPYCDRSFASQNALNPHLAKCKARQAVAIAAPSTNGHAKESLA